MVGGVWLDGTRAGSGRPAVAAPILVSAFVLAALRELVSILAGGGLPAPRRLVLAAGALLLAGKWVVLHRRVAAGGAWLALILTVEISLLCAWLLRDRDLRSAALRTAACTLALAFTALLATMLDVAFEWGTSTLVALILTAKAGDSGAYLVGKSIGRRKLIEHVSPSKTVEGAVAGFASSLLVGAWLFGSHGALLWSTGEILVVAAAVNVAGQLGDLIESAWKRAAGVKDSGRLLPEFGGALDLVDSLFLAIPVGFALLRLLAG